MGVLGDELRWFPRNFGFVGFAMVWCGCVCWCCVVVLGWMMCLGVLLSAAGSLWFRLVIAGFLGLVL